MVTDMSTQLGDLVLSNPVMTASGTFGYGFEYEDFMALDNLGAFIVKGTTLEPRQGNDYPRMAQTPAGMLNAVGLQNPGVEHFIEHTWPRYGALESKVIVNVSGAKIEDYVRVAELLAPLEGLRAIELNISCPNVKQGGMAFGTTCDGAASVTRAVRDAWPRHLMVKLSPNVTSITDIALAVEGAGADSVSLINTLMGMAIDIERRRPMLSTVTGGMSGPAVKPVAVRMVWQVAKAVKIPVVGLGGIASAADAIEFIMAGASAVQIGTYNFVDPSAAGRIPAEIDSWCQAHGVSRLMELKGII
ncbi:MAG: dihydroorotate dehydrogenase [Muribaculaceae bacterium]|nr:dihydroorotate dehydrogenase [Muribaculaceae bacterium]